MTKKVLHQVDLSKLAKPVKSKKKVIEPVIETAEPEKPYATKKLPEKIKKEPTEKQLAARAKLKAAREKKLEDARIEKERVEAEIKQKEEELSRKKLAQAEKKRLKREEKKAILKPLVVSEIAVQPEEPEIKLKLADVIPKKVVVETIKPIEPVERQREQIIHRPDPRKRYYPFGLSLPVNKRMR